MKKSESNEPKPEPALSPADEQAAAAADAEASPETTEPTQLTPGQLEELKTRAAKADENWERLLRTTADFDNFKKRAAREKQEAIRFANESLIQKVIPVLDNFEMALAAAQSSSADGVKSLQDGVAMIQTQLKNLLAESGLEEVNAEGQPFDPNLHEAVSQQASSEVAEGHVLQQLRKGYKLRERLLRPATVIVAKAPPADSPSETRAPA
jgi:molecular chaperone GrpE